MSRPFAVFDIDGTLIRWQMFHAFVDQLAENGHRAPGDYAAAKTARSAWKNRRGEESFREYEAKLVAAFENILTKLTCAEYDLAVDMVFDEYKGQVYRYTRELIENLKARGYVLFAVSGSPSELVGRLAEHYGFDDFAASEHIRQGSHFTGEVQVAVHNKPKLLHKLVAKHGLGFAGSVGIGDSEGDIDMLGIVEKPIAFNPSQKLFRHARAQGWPIVLERKNMVYELEPAGGEYRLARTNATLGTP